MNSVDAPPLSVLAARLEVDAKGNPYPHVANVLAILAFDPALAGLIGHCEFTEEQQLLRPPPALNPGDAPAVGPYPWALRISDVIAIAAHIQRAFLPRATRQTVEDALRAEAERHRFHPVRDWLASLRWDGVERLDRWLTTAFGTEDTAYTRAVGAKTVIAAVRRIRVPGAKFDNLLILEGNQGIGKSRCLRRLFGDCWFSDAMPPDLASKDGSMAVLGIWGIELAEIEHLVRTDPELIKAFLSRPVERFRPPYERAFLKRGRQSIFIGSTNSDNYLKDSTGGRRFWPVRCNYADEGWIAENRDQLWSEAAAREAAGETVWLEEDAAAAQVEEAAGRLVTDLWSERAASWLKEQRQNGATYVTAARLLSEGLGLSASQMGRREEMRAGLILVEAGLRRHTARADGKLRKVWRWPE
ncbi:VapE domain-containing protein [Roseicella frigidaeris]|uniref:DNA primase n=1 Tax=Roseicella frigidaeris TaxID=2230885 RepID=A0A327M0U6_9PROT|nr:VapE domain-containing protein [Roseicella frigidaeris]RAI55915.1 DNA primase [Roseicella frigidaeris]